MAEILPLPIDDFLDEALEHLRHQPNLVITASPGAGKTTRLPAYLARHSEGKVLVLEPRRMAAMAAAQRVAEEQSWQLGNEVGFQVRFENQTREHTKLIFLTEALLSRKLAQDPQLTGVEYVILDEFHERSVHVDIALGLLRELQDLGGSIKLVVMSATLDSSKISTYLKKAPILDVPGKLFPLELRYQKNSQLLQTGPPFYENLFSIIKEAEQVSNKNILVFLPGTGEIDQTHQLIALWAEQKKMDVVLLHGSLPLEEQRKTLQAGSRRRLILSTNIAESSVTVDGVACVIDTGLAKSMKYDIRTGFSRLEMTRISRASAQQRAGRAARQFPGLCYRLWNKLDETSMTGHDLPEILRTDLSESLLFLAAQGVRDFNSFSWFDKPGPMHLKKATDDLCLMNALDEQNILTPIGKLMLGWPLPPRLAKLMLVAIEMNVADLGADIAAILQERNFIQKKSSEIHLADQLENDLQLRLESLWQLRTSGKTPLNSQRGILQTVKKSAQQIRSYCSQIQDSKIDNLRDVLKRLILNSFNDRLCRRRSINSERGLMVGGRGVRLSTESLVRESDFFIALDGVDNSKNAETLVSIAIGLDKNTLFSELSNRIEKKKNLHFDREKGQFYLREGKYFRDLCLEEGGISIAEPTDVIDHLPEVLTEEWDWVLKQNEPLANWCDRLSYLISTSASLSEKEKNELADFDEAQLFTDEQKKATFALAATGEKNLTSVVKKDLICFFEGLLPTSIVNFLRSEVPEKIKVPSGNYLKVRYSKDRGAHLEVRIQEIFGWTETPKILKGTCSLTLHLLGPNYRPVQVTSDLQSFWKNGYAEVRKELRTRYPKHSWPENPLTATAVAKGRPTKG